MSRHADKLKEVLGNLIGWILFSRSSWRYNHLQRVKSSRGNNGLGKNGKIWHRHWRNGGVASSSFHYVLFALFYFISDSINCSGLGVGLLGLWVLLMVWSPLILAICHNWSFCSYSWVHPKLFAGHYCTHHHIPCYLLSPLSAGPRISYAFVVILPGIFNLCLTIV